MPTATLSPATIRRIRSMPEAEKFIQLSERPGIRANMSAMDLAIAAICKEIVDGGSVA